MKQYQKNERGDLRLVLGQEVRLTIPAGDDFGILYDRELGTIFKHGPAELVIKEHRKMWSTLMRGDMTPENKRLAIQACELMGIDFGAICNSNTRRTSANDLEFIRMPVSAMNDVVIEEINACLDCSGRAARLTERLAEMQGAEQKFAP